MSAYNVARLLGLHSMQWHFVTVSLEAHDGTQIPLLALANARTLDDECRVYAVNVGGMWITDPVGTFSGWTLSTWDRQAQQQIDKAQRDDADAYWAGKAQEMREAA